VTQNDLNALGFTRSNRSYYAGRLRTPPRIVTTYNSGRLPPVAGARIHDGGWCSHGSGGVSGNTERLLTNGALERFRSGNPERPSYLPLYRRAARARGSIARGRSGEPSVAGGEPAAVRPTRKGSRSRRFNAKVHESLGPGRVIDSNVREGPEQEA